MIILPGKAATVMRQLALPVDQLAALGEFSKASQTARILSGIDWRTKLAEPASGVLPQFFEWPSSRGPNK